MILFYILTLIFCYLFGYLFVYLLFFLDYGRYDNFLYKVYLIWFYRYIYVVLAIIDEETVLSIENLTEFVKAGCLSIKFFYLRLDIFKIGGHWWALLNWVWKELCRVYLKMLFAFGLYSILV